MGCPSYLINLSTSFNLIYSPITLAPPCLGAVSSVAFFNYRSYSLPSDCNWILALEFKFYSMAESVNGVLLIDSILPKAFAPTYLGVSYFYL